jgi:ATP-binding cassette subfamily B multidrug efflux pump
MHGGGGGMRRMAEMPEEKAKDTRKIIARLIKLMLPYYKTLLGALVLVLLTAGSQGAGPVLIGKAVDDFIGNSNRAGLAWVMLALLVVYVIGAWATRTQMFLIGQVGQKLLADLRQKVFNRVQSLSVQYIESKFAGDLMSRLVNDIDALNNFFSQVINQLIGSVFGLLGIMIAMLILNWQLALAVLVAIPLLLVTTNLFAGLARKAFRKTRETLGDVSAGMEEEISGVKVAQAFNRTEENVRRFKERNDANRNANVNATAVTSAFAPTMDVISTLDTALIAALGGLMVIRGSLTVGVVVAFLQYSQNFFRPLSGLAQLWTMMQSALAAAERVFELLDTEPDVKDAADSIELQPIKGTVEFQGVSFHYKDDEPVLENVNFLAKPGETIAVVGPTGAGKTTLVNLIGRFYDVDDGKILVDGNDVRTVTQSSLRKQMGIVTQEPFLFSGTIMDNIRYGKLSASDDDVISAAVAANSDGFINRLPEGYQSAVGERGKLLSQGQRQLISIARAILADPRILILDEATANIDTRTEVLIQSALNKLLKGRTSFVIAHRLSTVRNADVVLVIDDGRIVERGTHQDLLSKGGLYADLYQRQFYQPGEAGVLPVGV